MNKATRRALLTNLLVYCHTSGVSGNALPQRVHGQLQKKCAHAEEGRRPKRPVLFFPIIITK